MKTLFLLLAACFLFSSGDAQAASSIEIGQRMKDPIVIKSNVSPLLNVTFNHNTHLSMPCKTCHHEEGSDGYYVSCTECHAPTEPRDMDVMSQFGAYHAKDSSRSCYGCHKKMATEKPGAYPMFTNCRPCHMSDEARAAAMAEAKK